MYESELTNIMMTENQRMTELLQLINCLDVGLEIETLRLKNGFHQKTKELKF